MNQEGPWLYVAMIVIAFISWVFNRIQEATAERRRVQELKRRKREGGAPPPLPGKERQEGRSFEQETGEGDIMKELMEALGVPREEAPPQPPPRRQTQDAASAPRRKKPQAPHQAFPLARPVAERLSAAERAALERVQARETAEAGPPKVAHRGRGAANSLRKILSTSEGMRQAMLLREIVGPPVSMKQEEPR